MTEQEHQEEDDEDFKELRLDVLKYLADDIKMSAEDVANSVLQYQHRL